MRIARNDKGIAHVLADLSNPFVPLGKLGLYH